MKKGFTLGEIVIALVIIGVVSALTVPTLFSGTKDTECITQLKKFDTVIQNAFDIIIVDNESKPVSLWEDYIANPTSETLVNKLSEQLKVRNNCTDMKKCFALDYTPYNSNSKTNIFTKTKAESGTPFSIIDGSSLIISEPSPDCSISIGGYDNVCAYLYVDTNGVKKPNRYGKDVFGYYLRSNQITPFGLADDTSNSMTDLCSKSSNSAYNGIACTGWVIYNKNLEYQKCSYGSSGIQWNVSGKNTCS